MKNINNLTTSHFNKQFRTIIGHLPDSIGRTPDVTHFYFVYNYSCNKEPGTARTENSTPALGPGAQQSKDADHIFPDIPQGNVVRDSFPAAHFYAGHVPALY